MQNCIYKNLINDNRLTMVSFDYPWKAIRRDGFYKYLINYIK